MAKPTSPTRSTTPQASGPPASKANPQKLTRAQEPWIGSRGRIGVIIPSTNIGVEYDCQQFVPPGVTWHFSRFWVEQPDLSSDNMFLAFIDAIRKTIPDAMRNAMTCEPSYIMMGMSAETFWGGLEGNAEFEQRLRADIGPDSARSSSAPRRRAAGLLRGAPPPPPDQSSAPGGSSSGCRSCCSSRCAASASTYICTDRSPVLCW